MLHNDYARKYRELKEQADLADKMYQLTNHVLDWEWFMKAEQIAADYALQHEAEIWGDTDGGVIL